MKLPQTLPLLSEPTVISRMDDEAMTLAFSETACGSSRLVGGKGCQLALLTQLASAVNSPAIVEHAYKKVRNNPVFMHSCFFPVSGIL